MKTARMLVILVLALALVVGLCSTSRATPLGTAFMYRNLFIDGNDVLDGSYDLMVSLFDDPNEGELRGIVFVDDLHVNGGWFEIMLDFGDGVFDGSALWLETAVRPGELEDPNEYVILLPRREVMPTPYALYAKTAHALGIANGVPAAVYVADNGSVGIGTTSPSEKLDVEGNIHASGLLTSGSSIDIDGTIDRITATSGTIDFDNENLVTTGNVGIGTKSPGAELDVDGQIKIRGGLPENGKVLTSDASGLASWKTLPAGGDITAVSAGTGLSGGGTTGSVTLALQVPLILSAPVAQSEGVISVLNTGTGDGVNGNAVTGAGVTGDHLSTGNFGKLGTSLSGVMGKHDATGNWGELGASLAGVLCSGLPYAGQFNGNVRINGNLAVDGNLTVGKLIKAAGSFKIDHPLDPENKYLSHSFVESPDMMNVYNGNVTLDENGRATVRVPEYFQALNRDFRYQLTAIGAPGPNLYIAEEIFNNRFNIAGGSSGMKVSWQVTGIRHDPYAVANRIAVEEVKPTEELGYYLHPKAYGFTEEKSIETVRNSRPSQTQEVAKK